MAEGTFTQEQREQDGGVIVPVLVGDLNTMQADIRVEIHPDNDGPDFFRPEDAGQRSPSHTVKALSRTGKFIFAGKGWTKNEGKGPKLSVQMSDPRLQFNVWKEKDTENWRVTGGGFS